MYRPLFGTLAATVEASGATPAGATLARSERAMIADALSRHAFNVSHAARELGLSRPALYRRMARYGL